MDFIEQADNSVTRMIDVTLTQLRSHRDAGVHDEDFVKKLFREFKQVHKQMSEDSAAIHMALSCYRMAVLTDYISQLESKVDFHKSAVEFLLELDEFETI